MPPPLSRWLPGAFRRLTSAAVHVSVRDLDNNRVTTIGSRAFKDCGKMKDVCVRRRARRRGLVLFTWLPRAENAPALLLGRTPARTQDRPATAATRARSDWPTRAARAHGEPRRFLNNNRVTSLAPGTFNRTVSLEYLGMVANDLTSLPPSLLAVSKRLKEVLLAGNGITACPAALFENLPQLRVLDLEDNRLEELPPLVFRGLGKVNALRLGGNRIGRLDPQAFAGMGGLELLNLDRNQLASLPSGLFRDTKKLKRLALSDNQLTSLGADPFVALTKLTSLALDANRLSSIRGVLVAADAAKLADVNLDGNRIVTAATHALDMLAALPNMRRLSMAGNPLQCSKAGSGSTAAHCECAGATLLFSAKNGFYSCTGFEPRHLLPLELLFTARSGQASFSPTLALSQGPSPGRGSVYTGAVRLATSVVKGAARVAVASMPGLLAATANSRLFTAKFPADSVEGVLATSKVYEGAAVITAVFRVRNSVVLSADSLGAEVTVHVAPATPSDNAGQNVAPVRQTEACGGAGSSGRCTVTVKLPPGYLAIGQARSLSVAYGVSFGALKILGSVQVVAPPAKFAGSDDDDTIAVELPHAPLYRGDVFEAHVVSRFRRHLQAAVVEVTAANGLVVEAVLPAGGDLAVVHSANKLASGTTHVMSIIRKKGSEISRAEQDTATEEGARFGRCNGASLPSFSARSRCPVPFCRSPAPCV